jgi:GAF domain/FHA domain
MPACLTAYLPDAATRWLVRSRAPLTLGRGAECSLRIEHPSVSRLHARLHFDQDRWMLEDASSKNGVHVNGLQVRQAPLGVHDWFRLGDVSCEWSELDDAAADRAEVRGVEKRATSRFLVESLQRQTALPGLLQETVRAAVELAECDRGFLLLSENGELRVAASHGIAPTLMISGGFSGSVGAVQQALRESRPVVVNDASGDPAWSGRTSVVTGGLRTLLCLPLRVGAETVALVYADSARPGSVITGTDLELLQAFGERAALWISARRGLDDIARLAPGRIAWPDVVRAQGLAPA